MPFLSLPMIFSFPIASRPSIANMEVKRQSGECNVVEAQSTYQLVGLMTLGRAKVFIASFYQQPIHEWKAEVVRTIFLAANEKHASFWNKTNVVHIPSSQFPFPKHTHTPQHKHRPLHQQTPISNQKYG